MVHNAAKFVTATAGLTPMTDPRTLIFRHGFELSGMKSALPAFALPLLLSAGLLSSALLAHERADHDEAAPAGPPLILGVLDFPNSGAPAAQEAFERGVLLLHSFEFEDARNAFIEAQAADPGFVMAIWGEAMTLNHPLWAEQDRAGALEILARLPEPANQRASPREQMFLDAVFALYGYGEDPPADKPSRDRAYSAQMRRIFESYPDDLEVASFYALSLLGSVYERDFRTYMQAAAILEEVFAKQPRHPGAAHYLIHSYDDPVHAPLGLRAARVYATIAPAASHAQHMISHIYTSLGLWDEVVEANRKAVQVSEETAKRHGRPIASRSKHAMHWLQYALLQQGLYSQAHETMALMKADRAALPNSHNTMHYVLFRGSYAADQPTGPDLLPAVALEGLPLDAHAIDRFASGYRAIANGNAQQASADVEALQALIAVTAVKTVEQGLHEDDQATSPDQYLLATVMSRQLEALLMYRAGDPEGAIERLSAAAEDENRRALEYGPPYVPKPSSELLGEMLLEQGRPREAIAEFEKSLERNTRRSRSLLGLARAQAAAGEPGAAAATRALLASQWRGDPGELQAADYPWR